MLRKTPFLKEKRNKQNKCINSCSSLFIDPASPCIRKSFNWNFPQWYWDITGMHHCKLKVEWFHLQILWNDYHNFSCRPLSHIDTMKRETKKEKWVIFLMMTTLRSCSLNNFYVFHTAVLNIVIMLWFLSPGLTYLVTGSLYLLTTFFHPSPPHFSPLLPKLHSSFFFNYMNFSVFFSDFIKRMVDTWIKIVNFEAP